MPRFASALSAMAAACAFAPGCHPATPEPPRAPQPESAFFEVPYPPPAAPVETVPPQPSREALWVDGQWTWDGRRWVWAAGGWFSVPPGAAFAPWELRLERDGRLMFAAPAWRDGGGRELAPARLPVGARGEAASQAPTQIPTGCR